MFDDDAGFSAHWSEFEPVGIIFGNGDPWELVRDPEGRRYWLHTDKWRFIVQQVMFGEADEHVLIVRLPV